MRKVIFDGDDVRVVRTPGAREDVVFVTFESYQGRRAEDRLAFGEAFLQSRGYTAYHVLSRDNLWFQYPEMERAIAAIRADLPPEARVITYGVSMGGYGAVRFSGLLGVSCVIAFSPQYSIDPKVVPWERRWDRLFSSTPPVLWEALPLAQGVPFYVFYDPHNRDRWHVRMLARHVDVRRVRVHYAGHATIAVFLEAGLLPGTIVDIAEGRFDAAACQREVLARSDQSATYRSKRARKRARLFRRIKARLVDYFG